MRKDVQEIFRNTPHEKQVMMFSATMSKEIRLVCKKFMQDVITQIYASAYGIFTRADVPPKTSLQNNRPISLLIPTYHFIPLQT